VSVKDGFSLCLGFFIGWVCLLAFLAINASIFIWVTDWWVERDLKKRREKERSQK
jgi:UDP-N-acetylmuramyl pentapeptide phosphotransferase/UDP-N-acetylglucosamine-1-phosphate transferase